MEKRFTERFTDLGTRVLIIQWIGAVVGVIVITEFMNRLLKGSQTPAAPTQPAAPDPAQVAAITVAVLSALKAQQEKEHQTEIVSPA